MKKTVYTLIGLLLVVVLVVGGIYAHNKIKDITYSRAVTLIQNGNYEAALVALEKINPDELDQKYFDTDMYFNKLDDCYKNTTSLYSYALAQLEYNSEKVYLETVNEYLEFIPADYSGEISDEIKTFKENFKPQYDEFLKEEERKAEEARIEAQKREQEFIAGLKNKTPYVGMNEKYINDTMMGRYHDYEVVVVSKGTKREHTEHEYRWKSDSGKTIFFAECEDGKVTEITKYWEDKYWTADGRPIYSGMRSGYKPSWSGKKRVYNGDDYDVDDYYDAEDFYYDHYDDFYEYEEAEDYFNEHGEW